MNKSKSLQFAVLFLLLGMLTMSSMGLVDTSSPIVQTVSAMETKGKDDGNTRYVSCEDYLVDWHGVRLFKEEKVCAVTAEEANKLAAAYDVETKQYTSGGKTVNLLMVKGKSINRVDIEKTLGIKFKGCRVVHGHNYVAVISPVYVS